MTFDFDQVIDRRNSDSNKWRHYPADILPLWVADMDFESPRPIMQNVLERVQHNVFGYGSDSPTFRAVLVERMKRLYAWEIQAEDIVFLPGLVCGLNTVSRAIGSPGDGVLINTPVYPPFISAPTNQGRATHMAELALVQQGGHLRYEIDTDALKDAVQSNTKLFILCNPHNPTGRAYSRQELSGLAAFCTEHDLTICSDEIHCDLLLGGATHLPMASISPEIAQRTITLMAPSKTFNIPGLGCSFAIVQNRELRQQVARAAYGIVPHVNVLGMVAGETAYSDPECDQWLQGLRAYLTDNRDFLVRYVAQHLPMLKTTVPEATYLAWLDCREAEMGENPYKFCLDKAKVAFNDGSNFGKGGAGFIRINMGCPRSILEEGLARLRTALGK